MDETVLEIVKKAVKKLSINIDDPRLKSIIEIPKDRSKGDFAFPCFSLAGTMKMPPHEIAVSLREAIGNPPADFKDVVVEGAYLNFFIDRKKLAINLIKEIEGKKNNFGRSEAGNGKNTMIEFSQPNTHKAFHVGHIRGTAIGESLARIS